MLRGLCEQSESALNGEFVLSRLRDLFRNEFRVALLDDGNTFPLKIKKMVGDFYSLQS